MDKKIVIAGGAGLVGQNLIVHLKRKGYKNIVVIDKHRTNLTTLQRIQPDITAVYADLAVSGDWQQYIREANVVVMLQAQIGGNNQHAFIHNNVTATRLILDTIQTSDHPAYLIHVSSSVVESEANDFYTNTKKEQEQIVAASGISHVILRPTLMFGWFDRKHLGWLSRFMQKVPVFPVPGNGRYLRQPLYAGDFCHIIISCIENPIAGIYDITGYEKKTYIDIIREIKHVTHAKTPIVKIPYRLFYSLLWVWGMFDRNPPFTTQQLTALVAKDEFAVIDWPSIFGVTSTPFHKAIEETFTDPHYSKIILEF